jgi:type IV pilus assembly protein PilA
MKMKNRKGFTLIELLAVITILGILMIVAIPAVSRTIENSRRNTFLSTAKEYANSVKTKYAADEIRCGNDSSSATILASGKAFAVRISTDSKVDGLDTTKTALKQKAYNNAKELVNQGGVSSWGNADVYGWVVGVVQTEKGNDGNDRQVVKYYINLVDVAGHGISWNNAKETDNLTRADVLPADAKLSTFTGTLDANSIASATFPAATYSKWDASSNKYVSASATAQECYIG